MSPQSRQNINFSLALRLPLWSGKGAIIASWTDRKVNQRNFPVETEAAGFLSLDVWLFFFEIIISYIWKVNSSIQAYYQQKTLDQNELRWMHSMPRRITSVCTASTNTRLLLRCTFHSECPDMSLIEVIVMTVPGMSEWKKTTGLTGNFQLMPVRAASFFFQLHKSTCSFCSRRNPVPKPFFFFCSLFAWN